MQYEAGPNLALTKATKIYDLQAKLQAMIAAGAMWNGHLYQIDETSQGRIHAVSSLAAECDAGVSTWPVNFAFIDATNMAVPMTTTEARAFAAYMAETVYLIRAVYWQKRAAIVALTTARAVMAYDIESGWPTI